MIIRIIPCAINNYAYLIYDPTTAICIAIDPTDAGSVLAKSNKLGWHINYIINTHHHHDHTGGNLEIQKITNCSILGYADDWERIPGITQKLFSNQKISLGNLKLKILFIPGHTLGHIGLWFYEHNNFFCGDTLFSLGCGKLFEGTIQDMWNSLNKIRNLPKETNIFCGHEYTEHNACFALKIDPQNTYLYERFTKIKILRQHNKPTIPVSLSDELLTNPFLRADSIEIKKRLGYTMETDPSVVLLKLRELKNIFNQNPNLSTVL
ncbi:MAG: hydroxyacylglutathione hydrolase [Alphaproteobacteria bacterium]|nr:hydroxyacylglutathione hydrolase [Alphaproteobacteria bacterium]